MATKIPKAEIVVVYNPEAASANETRLRRVVAATFGGRSVAYCTCTPNEDMSVPLAPWLNSGTRLVFAAGGDGTISDVAAALVNQDVVLGILPQGTSNVLARELNLPLRLEEAASLLAGDFALRQLDVLRVGREVCLLGVSVGLSAAAMLETGKMQKKMLGPWAYWLPFFRRFFDTAGSEFLVEVDGKPMRLRASDLLAMNVGTIGFRALRWGSEIHPDDGVFNLCYLHARSGLDYLWTIMNFLGRRYIRSERLDCLPVRQGVRILAPQGLPVQGDGDIIGHTPVEVTLQAAVLKVAVPRNDQ